MRQLRKSRLISAMALLVAVMVLLMAALAGTGVHAHDAPADRTVAAGIPSDTGPDGDSGAAPSSTDRHCAIGASCLMAVQPAGTSLIAPAPDHARFAIAQDSAAVWPVYAVRRPPRRG